jgi:hypothetical protein
MTMTDLITNNIADIAKVSSYFILLSSGLLALISLVNEIRKIKSKEKRKVIFGLSSEEKKLVAELPIKHKPILESRKH